MAGRKGQAVKKVISYALLVLLSLFVLVPLLWIVSTSFKPAGEVFSIPPVWVPEDPTVGNYEKVLTESSIPRYFMNSLLVGLLTTFIALLLGGAAGYGFARYKFRGNNSMSLFMLISQMLPLTVLMIPIYFMMVHFGLLDSVPGLAIAHLILVLPVVTWMCRSYFASVPKEIEESAQIDGCTHLGALFRVILPIVAPGLAATAIYAFIMSWNEFVLASILTLSDKSRTLPIGLTEFSSSFNVDWGSTMAASMLISVPVIVFFLWLQKYFVEGLGQGAVKG
ncbi:carbohydrate ABC transporter permease [Xylanibacillus composti]|uniref:ABC transporter permease n=1 Tax=Xylanibacillus composti TaxID=1572762 RepID=A0A8J4H5J4_9BACL|nr:carbohydrate ABC transporter permease [Xylanibacillus composti]MDT9726939.1 carbohydrate ABC transporter permease [Xylanibacillus composti]GIQ70091.1 ABC transporter permease [Xylanibacillus composti]